MEYMEYRPGSRWYLDDGEHQIAIYPLDPRPLVGKGLRKLPTGGATVEIYWYWRLMRTIDVPADAEWIYRVDRMDEFTDRLTFPDGTVVDMHPDNGEPKLKLRRGGHVGKIEI